MPTLPGCTELAQGIQSWLAIESPSAQPATVWAMAQCIERHALGLGLHAHLTQLGNSGLPLLHIHNRAPGDDRSGVLVLGHMDTVHPVGTLQQNPCRIEGDKLYGPGSYDMKGSIYLALTALGHLGAAQPAGWPIDMLLVPDEETGSHASRASIEAFAARSRYALVCEPARADGGKCVTARKGTGMVQLRVHGRPAHAGVNHEKGRSAVKELAHQILALEAMTDYPRGVTVSVGVIRGGTVSNTVPSLCEAEVDFRIPDMQAGHDIVQRIEGLQAVGPDTRLEIAVEVNRPPMVKTAAVEKLLKAAQQCAQDVGFVLEDVPMTGGGSDANFVAALGVPVLDGLGADGDGAHTLHEHILVSTLERRLAFWQTMLARDLML